MRRINVMRRIHSTVTLSQYNVIPHVPKPLDGSLRVTIISGVFDSVIRLIGTAVINQLGLTGARPRGPQFTDQDIANVQEIL